MKFAFLGSIVGPMLALSISPCAQAAEIYSANITLNPTFDAGGCALTNQNGYTGTDRQQFVVPNGKAGYCHIKDFTWVDNWAISSVASYDPNTKLIEQALAQSGAEMAPLHEPLGLVADIHWLNSIGGS